MFRVLEGFVPARGARKYTVAIAALIFGFVLALTGKMTGAEFVTNTGLVIGLFGGANAAVHIAKARNGDNGPDEDS
jgi:hypothetical protein